MAVELIHNATFFCDARGSPHLRPGIYRVVFGAGADGEFAVVRIGPDDGPRHRPRRRKESQTGKKKAGRRKKSPPRMVGELIWVESTQLTKLAMAGVLSPTDVERQSRGTLTGRAVEEFESRKNAMRPFFDLDHLAEEIVANHGLGGLVREAQAISGKSRWWVYKLWSLLCRFGFLESSLVPRRDLQGAPGVLRPCDPGRRKKAGAKTLEQRVAKQTLGIDLDPKQPGMSTEWRLKILAADAAIPQPKPRDPERCDIILESFKVRVVENQGHVETALPDAGLYPTKSQISWVISERLSRLERLIEKTTNRHFNANLRGLTGRNWKGVAGPGHTWAIDSTIAEIYLRSSINRAWIVGRPIVYVIVDVWSTAVVGFHVCLTGPSWETAKVSLFNAVASPELMGELWVREWRRTLSPHPTMCFALMCDRGEYLSYKHRETAIKLLPLTSYAMPYRADLKGLVEVLHRIEKDAQYFFVPGAMDSRRAEMELRKVDPSKCVFTTSEYVGYLHELFSQYNLTADRSHRLDAHMIAQRVRRTPSGLWAWGHQVGLGFRRQISESELITQLLPQCEATVGRSSVVHASCDYMSDEVAKMRWTAVARNFGSWKTPDFYYPGSMSRIWIPNPGGSDLLKLTISEETNVSMEATYDEWLDAKAVKTMGRQQAEHEANQEIQRSRQRMHTLVEEAKSLTAKAVVKASGSKPPPMREARAAEVAAQTANREDSTAKETSERARDAAFDTYSAAYREALK